MTPTPTHSREECAKWLKLLRSDLYDEPLRICDAAIAHLTAQPAAPNHIWGNKASPNWPSCNVCGYVRTDKNKDDPCRGAVKVELRDLEKQESTESIMVMPDGSVKAAPMKTADATMIYLATLGVFRSDITEDELQAVCDAINSAKPDTVAPDDAGWDAIDAVLDIAYDDFNHHNKALIAKKALKRLRAATQRGSR